jgi:hypothetical protein
MALKADCFATCALGQYRAIPVSQGLPKPRLFPLPLDLAACNFVHCLFLCATLSTKARTMPDIEYLRAEIERMRIQVHRQRGEIRQLQRAGIPTASAEALLDRMLHNIDGLCAERDQLKKEQPGSNKGKVLGGRRW